jgi:hypothetical protein
MRQAWPGECIEDDEGSKTSVFRHYIEVGAVFILRE